MSLAQQTLTIVFAMIVIVGLGVAFILMQLKAIAERSERLAKEWYRAVLVREVERLASDDQVVQEEIKALVDEMRALVTEIREAASDDLLDWAGHFARLDSVQERMTSRQPHHIALPGV